MVNKVLIIFFDLIIDKFSILPASSLVAIDVPSQTFSGLNIYAGTFKGAVIGQDASGHPLSAGPYSVMA